MLFERIESEGLAHYSYLIGDQHEAIVIDPRRDCQVYVDTAARAGFRITHILETHRNEDYVIGSVELAARTGAKIWHADAELDYQYGHPAEDGQEWPVGRLRLRAIFTPGHTPGSMSYLLHDPDGHPWVVFTGDALFAGDVGRVDLPGVDRKEEMAHLLYDSLFNKLLPLGDEVIVCPGHGAGSVCGNTIAERVWTTIGLERRTNPKLQYTDEATFVENAAVVLERPPYFRRMERLNLEGAPLLGSLPIPTPLKPDAFAERMDDDAVVLDTRMETGFGAAHVADALSIWTGGLASFAGWFLPYDRPLLLVTAEDNLTAVVRTLVRLGYDDVSGLLAGGMLTWHMAGQPSEAVELVTAQTLCQRLERGDVAWFLDVRSEEELENEGEIEGGHHIHITELPNHLSEIPHDRPIYVFCGSGLRSMLGASILRRAGVKDVRVVLGGTLAWESVECHGQP
jgi:hydroxyacylglutathione hydrolase